MTNPTTALVTIEQDRFLPALSMQQARERRDALVLFVREIMVPGVDFGPIPGTEAGPNKQAKNVLHKPGAERLSSFFGLTPDFEVVKEVEQWDGEEPLFYYRYKCRLMRDGRVVGDGEGSCNSRESKYRWRDAKRVCPACGQPAIIKGKAEYGGGWVCFKKQGGCNAKYLDGDIGIEGQQIGCIPNPDIFDLVNTIQKMAQKRAFIGAVLIAVNASEYFTQDLDDLPQPAQRPANVDTRTGEIISHQNGASYQATQETAHGPQPPRDADEAEQRFYTRYATEIGGQEWAAVQRFLETKAPRPKTVEGWINAAEAVQCKMLVSLIANRFDEVRAAGLSAEMAKPVDEMTMPELKAFSRSLGTLLTDHAARELAGMPQEALPADLPDVRQSN